MNYRIKVRVPVEKRGFFGRKKIVYEERTIVVDSKTYRKIKRHKMMLSWMSFLILWRKWISSTK